LLTAAVVELGRSEEWFWDTTPRVMTAMMEEKRKLDIARDRMLVHILCGGKIDDVDDEPSRAGIPGVDYPATNTL